jgi:tetratricopeptide (TPR) repeat protein
VAKLVVFRGDAVEKEIPLRGGIVRIGRHDRNDVVLDDSLNGVSRFHAEIRSDDGNYFIIDTNSRNGVWINGRRIKQRAPLALGVPVTIGAFELALEDDVPSAQDDLSPARQHTVATATAVGRRDGPAAARTSRGSRSSIWSSASLMPRTRQILLWSGAAVAVLVICVATYAVIRYRSRPVPVVARVEPPRIPAAELPPPTAEPVDDSRKTEIAEQMKEAGDAMTARDYLGAIAHLNRVLELDPDNQEAQGLKQQAESANAAATSTTRKTAPTPPKPDAVPEEPETPGIPRKPNETSPEYTARASRVLTAFREGKNSLEKIDYPAALSHFRAVERDQPRYLGVDLLIAEAIQRQQAAVADAISKGDLNEQAGKLREARGWYREALRIDSASTSAREKETSLQSRMAADAKKPYDLATLALKTGDREIAIRKYQQVVDQLLPGDSLWEQARKQLETLKQ